MELDEELETDLCTLWDMTADPDVALCLQRHDIFSLIQHILENSRAPRLTVSQLYHFYYILLAKISEQ